MLNDELGAEMLRAKLSRSKKKRVATKKVIPWKHGQEKLYRAFPRKLEKINNAWLRAEKDFVTRSKKISVLRHQESWGGVE